MLPVEKVNTILMMKNMSSIKLREPLKLIKIRDQRQKKYGSKKFQAHFVFIFHLYLHNTHLQVNFILNITFFTKVLQKKSASKL